jgi:beta-glucosidase/6-phospho-beta-glucosidase/beta-galactosidase
MFASAHFCTAGVSRAARKAPWACTELRRRAAQDRSGAKGQVWQCTGNVLRAHAAAVAAFRQLVPGGRIAMALNSDWTEPLTSSDEDKARAPAHAAACALATCSAVLSNARGTHR